MPSKGSTTERGYGSEHQRLRRKWAPKVRTGKVECSRCGVLIAPDDEWDLDHDDVNRNQYRGPSHARCNRATAGRTRTPKRFVL